MTLSTVLAAVVGAAMLIHYGWMLCVSYSGSQVQGGWISLRAPRWLRRIFPRCRQIEPLDTSFEPHTTSAVLHRDLGVRFLPVIKTSGFYHLLEGGRNILDASGGAAVQCIGGGDHRVIQAMTLQASLAPYVASLWFTTSVQEQLCRLLVDSTGGAMARAYIVSSGSEAMEAAVKIARQYFLELDPPQPDRTRFISRQRSYHGITLGALSVSGHAYRREKFEPLLSSHTSHVAPCYAYRDQMPEESDAAYVERLARELDDEFQKYEGAVCAFIAEPVVGAALGCVTAVPGYFKAMRNVCHKRGALMIMDEVMCGMGRTGYSHAWQHEGVAPDIQTIGKGLGGGYQPVAGLLISSRVVDSLSRGSRAFVHGHTYQGHPVACAAALKVQQIVQEEGLVENAKTMGALLGKLLREKLSNHPNVGDIRGRGLFWGIEFVRDKATKSPFPAARHIAYEMSQAGVDGHSILVYPGSGTSDGIDGDHIIVAPAFTVSQVDVANIALKVARLVEDFFGAGV